ncbi:MAG: DNA alkylation repair protein [Saprospiraceae bacterium]|nr:DNA alkylation repair protein [Saprospiraceae bacterium]MBK8855387.1 DNA alkylation repair protein [Saprospiraceae bacterium]MBK9043749.1 DNA alkylation repair protein [Saprospiraceae bacterium]
MAEPLKNMYNDEFLDNYTDTLKQIIPSLDTQRFRQQFLTPEWQSLELKQRVTFLANATDETLPENFSRKIKCIGEIIIVSRKKGVKDQNFIYIFLCDIITRHGLDDPKTSIPAIEMLTSFTSFEFAGRPFIIRHPEIMMAQMKKWAQHSDPNVRRYASEGCRPRLPWGLQLKMFVDDPSPIIPILELLKDDSSEYVRKSVANNLNDISKDHPELVLSLIESWQKNASERTHKLLRQAARTLLKKGDTKTLSLFGNHDHFEYSIKKVSVAPEKLTIGKSIRFESELTNTGNTEGLYRLEYFVYFVKFSGNWSKKIFKITDKTLMPGQSYTLNKIHCFADLTTRKHYPGQHQLSLVVNGKEETPVSFMITQK